MKIISWSFSSPRVYKLQKCQISHPFKCLLILSPRKSPGRTSNWILKHAIALWFYNHLAEKRNPTEHRHRDNQQIDNILQTLNINSIFVLKHTIIPIWNVFSEDFRQRANETVKFCSNTYLRLFIDIDCECENKNKMPIIRISSNIRNTPKLLCGKIRARIHAVH